MCHDTIMQQLHISGDLWRINDLRAVPGECVCNIQINNWEMETIG